MTDTRTDRKWFYRCILLMIIALMTLSGTKLSAERALGQDKLSIKWH